MLHVPTINITVVFIIVIACAQTTVIAIIQRFNELAVFILWVEETSIGIEQVTIIVRFAQIMFGLVSLTKLDRKSVV